MSTKVRQLPSILVPKRFHDWREAHRLADLLGIEIDEAWPLALRLWMWAGDNCPLGDVSKESPETLARVSGWTGNVAKYIAALGESGYIVAGFLVGWREEQKAIVALAEEEQKNTPAPGTSAAPAVQKMSEEDWREKERQRKWAQRHPGKPCPPKRAQKADKPAGAVAAVVPSVPEVVPPNVPSNGTTVGQPSGTSLGQVVPPVVPPVVPEIVPPRACDLKEIQGNSRESHTNASVRVREDVPSVVPLEGEKLPPSGTRNGTNPDESEPKKSSIVDIEALESEAAAYLAEFSRHPGRSGSIWRTGTRVYHDARKAHSAEDLLRSLKALLADKDGRKLDLEQTLREHQIQRGLLLGEPRKAMDADREAYRLEYKRLTGKDFQWARPHTYETARQKHSAEELLASLRNLMDSPDMFGQKLPLDATLAEANIQKGTLLGEGGRSTGKPNPRTATATSANVNEPYKDEIEEKRRAFKAREEQRHAAGT